MSSSFKSTRIGLFFFLFSLISFAVHGSVQTQSGRLWSTSIGAGYAHSADPFGVAAAAMHSRQFGIHTVTLRTIFFNEIQTFGGLPHRYAFDFGLLYGPTMQATLLIRERPGRDPIWWSVALSLSSGIASLNGIDKGEYLGSTGMFEEHYAAAPFSAVGFPIQAELRLIPNSRYGVGIGGSANLNEYKSFFSSWIGIHYGLLRDSSEARRFSSWKELPPELKRRKMLSRLSIGCATLGCATTALFSHLRAMEAQGQVDDYYESHTSGTEDVITDKAYFEELRIVQSRQMIRNISTGLGIAGLLGFILTFTY